MKRKFLFLILIVLIMCITVCGCGENDKNNSNIYKNETYSSSSELQSESDVSNSTENDIDIKIQVSYNFSEDKAWIKFQKSKNRTNYIGCINKKGNLLFYYNVNNSNTAKVKPYSNGYSFLETSNSLYLLDKNGTILQTYPVDSNNNNKQVIAYADGYVWCQEYVAEFDKAYFKYTLYGTDGKSVTDFKYEGTEPIDSMNYYEKKVWGYDKKNEGKSQKCYYCTEGDKWVNFSYIPNDEYQFYFYDDTAIIGTTYDDEDDSIGYLSLIDTKGNLSYAQLPENVGRWHDIKCFALRENCCLLYNYSKDSLISYNVSSDKFVKMDNEYVDKINYDALPDDSNALVFENGKIALPLIGSDKESYIGLFDTSLNIIGEPIKSMIYDLSDGIFTIQNKDVYDDNLNLLFSADDFGYKAVSPFNNGVAHAKNDGMQMSSGGDIYGYEGNWFYIDRNGEKLFDSVNIKQAKEIELP